MIPRASIRNRNPFRSIWAWIKERPTSTAIGSLIALGVGALLWFIVWMAVPRNIVAYVSDISWMHMTHLRQRETRHNEEWYRQSTKGYYQEPVFNQTCERRYHYTHTYVCGSYRISCGENCTTTQYIYCSDPVYDDWCSYDYYEWPVVHTKQILGYDHNTYWETYDLKENQRMQMIASYEVNFQTSDDHFQYKPSSTDDYKRFTTGDKWQLTVGRIRRHNIEEMRKLD